MNTTSSCPLVLLDRMDGFLGLCAKWVLCFTSIHALHHCCTDPFVDLLAHLTLAHEQKNE